MMKKLGLKRSSSKNYSQTSIEPPHALPYPDTASYETHHPRDVVSERPVLSPDVLYELRRACALILRETGPSDEDYAAIINQPDPLEVYTQEQKDIRDVRDQASASNTSLPNLFQSNSSRKRDSKHLREDPKAANRLSRGAKSKNEEHSDRSSKRHQPKSVPPVNGVTERRHDSARSSHRRDSVPKPARQSAPAMPKQPIEAMRAPREARPKTLETVDADDSHQMDDEAPLPKPVRPDLDGQRKASHASRAPILADEIHPALRYTRSHETDDTESVHALTGHAYEMREDREKRISSLNPDYTHIPTLHPTMYRPPQPYQPAPLPYSRPQSRASGIIDNIRDGIRNYVQPRPSLASTRLASRFTSRDTSRIGSRSESRTESRSWSRSSSRPASRGSTFGSGNRSWFGLRRKNSWSSFRSAAEEEEMDRERGRDNKGPDLNRSLPPLPGLDQYKEPKMHIAMLARGALPGEELSSPTHDSTRDGTMKTGIDSPAAIGLVGMRTHELHPPEVKLEGGSPDIGPTPPAKSNPRTPAERRPSAKLEKKPRTPRRNSEKDLMAEQKKAAREAARAEKKAAKSGKKTPTDSKSPTSPRPDAASPPLPAPYKKTLPLNSEELRGKSSPRQSPAPRLNAFSPRQFSPEEQKSPLSLPVRSPSDASMVRIPFAGDDDDSTPATRVVSVMEPGFLDMEVQRRLKDGKVSSSLDTTKEEATQPKPAAAPEINEQSSADEDPPAAASPRPPPKDSSMAPPDRVASASPQMSKGQKAKSKEQQLSALLLQRPSLNERAYSTQTQASEARSLAALGVDRANPPVPPSKSPRTVARGERGRATSALGHYSDVERREALQPRESLTREPSSWSQTPQEALAREIVGGGALVGVEDGRKLKPAPEGSFDGPVSGGVPDRRATVANAYDAHRSEDRARLDRAIAYEREWHASQQQQQQQQQQRVAQRSMMAPTSGKMVGEAMDGPGEKEGRPRKSIRNRLSRLLGGQGGRQTRLVTATLNG